MRRLGYRVVDRVIEHLATLREQPAIGPHDRAHLMSALGGAVPAGAGDIEEAIDLLADVALASMQHGDHPRYFARVPGPAAFPAILGDWLATGMQSMAASWGGGAGPTTVELIVVEWLRELLGLPEGSEGILQSGGSMANLTALLAAIGDRSDAVVYCSDQTHSSLIRAFDIIGIPRERVHVVPSDHQQRLPLDIVRALIADDLRAGWRPAVLIGNAGTTNTGAVDPLDELADLRDELGCWLHVDGAYGAPAAMTSRSWGLFVGLDRADSVVIDPHKWLFQPYDIACVLVTRPGRLEATFTLNPEYLRDVTAAAGEVDLRNRGPELSRRGRALKLWLTFHTYGWAALQEAIERGVSLAEFAEAEIRQGDRWTLTTPAQLGIVTFAGTQAGDREHYEAAKRLTESGIAALTTTTVSGRSVFRLCTINPETTPRDIVATLDALWHHLLAGQST